MITTGIHNVTSVHIGDAEMNGGTERCPHFYATRVITIMAGDLRYTFNLFADTVESLSLPAERIPVTGVVE